MQRTIHCHKCGCYCGEIRDAKLKKGLAFVCVECRVPSAKRYEAGLDFMKEIFGMK